MTRNNKFAADVRKWAELTTRTTEQAVRGIAIALFRDIVQATPVDTGRLRGNWQTTMGAPASGEIDREDKSGNAAGGEIVTVVGQLKDGSVFLTNNLPYAGVVEFGEYPDPVKKGTRVETGKNKGQYEIRSKGGFSKKAPQGMLRLNVVRFQELVAREVRRLGGES